MDTEAAQSAAASAGEAGQASRSAPPSGLEGEGRDLEGAAASRPRTLHCCYSYRLLEESGPLSLLGDRRDVVRQREFMFIAWTDSIGELLTWRCLAVPPRYPPASRPYPACGQPASSRCRAKECCVRAVVGEIN